MCLTETQQKFEKVQFNKNIKKLETMRKLSDKKGGGITVLYPNNDLIDLEIVNSRNCDLLDLKGKLTKGKVDLRIIVVYFSVQNNQKDKENNLDMKKEIEKKIEEASEQAVIVIGDFNGHIGILGPQKVNNNGQIVLDLITDQNLILLNADENCSGEYTWQSKEHKSVIDFVLVNNNFYNMLVNMNIDEKKNEFDLSDHNLITANFKMELTKAKFNRNNWVETTFYTTKEESLKKFCKAVEQEIINENIESIEKFDQVMKEKADKELKRTMRQRIDKNKNQTESIWVTDEIREEIKKRKAINRAKRNCQDTNQKEILENQYKAQKEKAAMLVREAITAHEEKQCENIRSGQGRSNKKCK